MTTNPNIRIVERAGRFHVEHQVGTRHEIWIPKSWHWTRGAADKAQLRLSRKIELGLI